MSLVGVANSLMSAFLLSYFLFSCSRGRLLINKARLLGNKAGLLIGRKTSIITLKKLSFLLKIIRLLFAYMKYFS